VPNLTRTSTEEKRGNLIAGSTHTAILATKPKTSNKFLHFQQVVEVAEEKTGKHRLLALYAGQAPVNQQVGLCLRSP
jgi:hypothetical protein